MVYFCIQDTYMSLTWAIFNYMFSSTRMIIPLQAIMAKQRCFMQSKGNTTGLDSKPSLKNIARCAPLACTTSLCATNPTDFSSNSRSPICHGIQSLWISLRNFPCLPVMIQSWLLLINSPSRLYSSRPTIWSLLISWCSYSSFMSFRSVTSQA